MITASDMLSNTMKKCQFERGPPKKAQTSQGSLEFARNGIFFLAHGTRNGASSTQVLTTSSDGVIDLAPHWLERRTIGVLSSCCELQS